MTVNLSIFIIIQLQESAAHNGWSKPPGWNLCSETASCTWKWKWMIPCLKPKIWAFRPGVMDSTWYKMGVYSTDHEAHKDKLILRLRRIHVLVWVNPSDDLFCNGMLNHWQLPQSLDSCSVRQLLYFFDFCLVQSCSTALLYANCPHLREFLKFLLNEVLLLFTIIHWQLIKTEEVLLISPLIFCCCLLSCVICTLYSF